LRDVFNFTEAVFFLGTPHRGSPKAGIAEIARKIASVSGFNSSEHRIRTLQVHGTLLELIQEDFVKLYQRKDRHFQVRNFQEGKGLSGSSYLLRGRVIFHLITYISFDFSDA
jgi:nicotinic acid phosphoribosyltransferase